MASNQQDLAISQLLAQAESALRSGQFNRAMDIYTHAMTISPAHPAPYLGRGRLCLMAGHYEEALYWFENTLTRVPDLVLAMEGCGDALLALGRPEEALVFFERLQRANGKSSSAFHGAGEALKQLGRIAESRKAFEQATQLEPDNAAHQHALAHIARFQQDDSRLPALEALAKKIETLPEPARCQLHFALGKAYDDLHRYDEAFVQFERGNAIRRRHTAYNEQMFLGILSDLAAAFTPAAIEKRVGAGDPSDLPVFVIGMPRSGTSLIEQIIASHPNAAGAGELMLLHTLLGQNLAGPMFPAHFSDIPNSALSRLGATYVTHLRKHAEKSTRIVDKLPANFMLCGLIHLSLPNARIIHVKRNPLDTCFSCYANLFSENIDYSYDLGELGRYYRACENLMAHWHKVLPSGTILDVQYETLVDDFEAQAKRIIEYCGLPWDDACLHFHQTKRVVHTLSAAQLREPIYSRSVRRSDAYAAYLEPLRKALGIA